MDLWQIIVQGGPAGVLFVGMVMLAAGKLRTRQEVDVWKLFADEQKQRAERAEAREGEMAVAIRELNASVQRLLPGRPER
jgi:hypothetical protein